MTPPSPPRVKVMSKPGLAGSRSSLVLVGKMPIIAEDEDAAAAAAAAAAAGPAPAVPPRSQRRSRIGPDSLLVPEHIQTSGSAPSSRPTTARSSAASIASINTMLPGGGSLPDRRRSAADMARKEGFRESAWLARRGGWKRLALVALVVVAVAVALGVGLALGLRKKNTSSAGPDPAVPPPGLFPAGSFAFTTSLTTVSTACTSNPSTWRCFPYSTFAQSPSASAATFFWIITPVNSFAYAVSSSDNPFAPRFANLTMTLLDGNTFNERYAFNFTMPRTVVPSAPLDPAANDAGTCSFPDTLFSATIWTRRPGELHALGNGTAVLAAAAEAQKASEHPDFGPWPGRVEVSQVQRSGAGVPSCADFAARPVGGFALPAGAGSCSCRYANFDVAKKRRAKR